ncbi:MAG: hypothetical protein ACYSW1_20320, partial [Planctomycetota bacterium]
PTIRLDAGWLYILAGLALCAAGIPVPARRDLEDLRRQLDRLADERAISDARLHAYGSFLHLLNEDDPALIRRLAAAQLNLVPADEKPVLMAASRTATVTNWIDENIQPRAVVAEPAPVTLLGRLVGGRGRLWVLAAGIVVVFVGLLLDDIRAPTAQRRRPKPVVPRWPVAPEAARRREAPRHDSELNPWYDE